MKLRGRERVATDREEHDETDVAAGEPGYAQAIAQDADDRETREAIERAAALRRALLRQLLR
jgi:hypothetical protein